MTATLFLTDILGSLGVGQQVIVALSAGLIVWYAWRAMGFGRAAAGFIGQLTRYGMAVATFLAVGIYFGWVSPFVMLGDLNAAAAELARLVGEFGDDAIQALTDLISGGSSG